MVITYTLQFILFFFFGLVQAWREQHGSTEIDSIAKAVVFYAGGQYTLRPKMS